LYHKNAFPVGLSALPPYRIGALQAPFINRRRFAPIIHTLQTNGAT